MAKKYPLTPEGVKAKQDELYKLGDRELQVQAVAISKDSTAWLTENFELSSEQLDYVKQLPEGFNLPLGWQIATVVIGRQPFEFAPIPENTEKAANSRKKTEVTVGGSTTINPATGQTTYTVSGGIKWSW
ncbi:hypothetical protein SAMN05421856_10585 [Chryseobacterium taichungense]|uniref:Uncharacterized protein n=1 Tax=Chryseobacterium taichungense TaxID=295069 RepID=A0A1H8A629_9FLAO|nr:hypothetical protein [Chryseobacterium taichungense]SEM65249.1 hypothetical protein SAMN05421856_10585 [Chryseobacterium taichungense]